MSIFIPNTGTIDKDNIYFGYYGSTVLNSGVVSLKLSGVSDISNNIIDDNHKDKALPSGSFAHNNDRPVGSRQTNQIANTNNDILLNMDNTTIQSDGYPGKELFGNENTSQYIYSNNPRKDRIGVF